MLMDGRKRYEYNGGKGLGKIEIVVPPKRLASFCRANGLDVTKCKEVKQREKR